ncbi:UDP-N-acetylmuramoyl-L-alanine--D-glutamate ligase [Alteromonas flava]|uniref:UDP-N-acetylmuramoyl-L-alanine--D-glutamate ligase n=1 Tax=Alteromonas flava TaxID=2048003 RepID=UPI000C287BAC|nr:UDP-N-acetylmuramoyl-L-alanine--D-glutamate ligase [Alteromonas flava]
MTQYTDKNIAIIGAGLTGLSCARYLRQQAANVTLFDTRATPLAEVSEPVTWGEIPAQSLSQFDAVVVSPGVPFDLPALEYAKQAGVAVLGDIELFAQANTRPIIGITGSNGKSTVVSLLGHIFTRAGVKTAVIGNIGTPVLDALQDKQNSAVDWFILELSSFQLESTSSLHCDIAAVLNISEDHLDRHHTMEAYRNAKMRIYGGAKQCLVLRDDPVLSAFKHDAHLSFGLSPAPVGMAWNPENHIVYHNGIAALDFSRCNLAGEHNVLNVQVAYLVAILAGIEPQLTVAAIEDFHGIAHRYEQVGVRRGVIWINDSKATNPGAALASIVAAKKQTQNNLIVIMGGEAKGANLAVLAAELTDVRYVIALGRDGRQFLAMQPNSVYVDNMQQAVELAESIAQSGDIILLAPACASLDMFKNYQHRGDCFKQAFAELAA